MIAKWAVQYAILFLLTELTKAGKTINWSTVKAECDPYVRKCIPGTMFDDQAVSFADSIVDVAAKALQSREALDSILSLLGEQKWGAAFSQLQTLIAGSWQAHEIHEPFYAALQDIDLKNVA